MFFIPALGYGSLNPAPLPGMATNVASLRQSMNAIRVYQSDSIWRPHLNFWQKQLVKDLDAMSSMFIAYN